MSKYYGLNLAPATRQAIEQFENTVLIRRNNQQLVGSVYMDMQDVCDRSRLLTTTATTRPAWT